jgi:hypothetical protein
LARGKYTLDGYDIMAKNLKLYAENEWELHFRIHIVALSIKERNNETEINKGPTSLCSTNFGLITGYKNSTVILMKFHASQN